MDAEEDEGTAAGDTEPPNADGVVNTGIGCVAGTMGAGENVDPANGVRYRWEESDEGDRKLGSPWDSAPGRGRCSSWSSSEVSPPSAVKSPASSSVTSSSEVLLRSKVDRPKSLLPAAADSEPEDPEAEARLYDRCENEPRRPKAMSGVSVQVEPATNHRDDLHRILTPEPVPER